MPGPTSSLNPTTKPLSHSNILPEDQQTADCHAAKNTGHLGPAPGLAVALVSRVVTHPDDNDLGFPP